MHAESARIVLASGSPRREELLRRVAREFEIAPSGFEEPAHGRPIARALAAARGKAHDAARQRDAIVIGADTLVVVGRAVLGKPRSRDDARAMLGRLSGRCHTVVTGLCVLDTRRSIERSAVVTRSALGVGDATAVVDRQARRAASSGERFMRRVRGQGNRRW